MWASLIKPIADMFASLFNWRTSASDNEATHEVISTKKDLKKACYYADLAVEEVQDHAVFPNPKHKRAFEYFAKKFRKFR